MEETRGVRFVGGPEHGKVNFVAFPFRDFVDIAIADPVPIGDLYDCGPIEPARMFEVVTYDLKYMHNGGDIGGAPTCFYWEYHARGDHRPTDDQVFPHHVRLPETPRGDSWFDRMTSNYAQAIEDLLRARGVPQRPAARGWWEL